MGAAAKSNPYRCRLCAAPTYRKLVERGPDGVMRYSGLYRCSGCSVTFTDPAAWREGSQASASGPAPIAAPQAPSLVTWGGVLSEAQLPEAFGRSAEDLRGIREAAARANKGKSKGRRS